MTQNDFINIRIDKLNIQKQSLETLLKAYLSSDPLYPENLLRSQIEQIDAQITALIASRDML